MFWRKSKLICESLRNTVFTINCLGAIIFGNEDILWTDKCDENLSTPQKEFKPSCFVIVLSFVSDST